MSEKDPVVDTVMIGAEPAAAVVKIPVVLGTAAFNAAVVQALLVPLARVLRH